MLIDKNMYKKDLAAELNISSATMAKMGKGENVSLDVLQKICEYMDCNIGDIMSFEKEEKDGWTWNIAQVRLSIFSGL